MSRNEVRDRYLKDEIKNECNEAYGLNKKKHDFFGSEKKRQRNVKAAIGLQELHNETFGRLPSEESNSPKEENKFD